MKKQHGGARAGAGKKPLPQYLKRIKLTGVRLPVYKIESLKSLGELTALIEQALDDKYADVFRDELQKQQNETRAV